MTKIICALIVIFSTNLVHAYFPSLDSLLMNENNIGIGPNTVQANLTIVELDKSNNQILLKENALIEKKAIKLLIVNENENKPTLTQVNYKGGVFSNDALVDYIYGDVESFQVFSSNENDEQIIESRVFYSTLLMLLNNSSEFLIRVLKQNMVNIQNNTQLVNIEKRRLLSEYKSYLVELKQAKKNNEDESSLDTPSIKNPLKPEDVEEKEVVNRLIKSSYLNNDSIVKRIKIEDDFFWIVDEKKLYIKFDKNHRILEMVLKLEQGEMKFVFGKFVVHGAQLIFPEFIWYTGFDGKKFEIKAKKLTMFKDTKEAHRKRLKRYSKRSELNKIIDTENRPKFLL